MTTHGANAWRNRIVESRLVDASELAHNPRNFRRHPEHQKAALVGVLNEVGIAARLIAYYSERAGGALTLIDGELRDTLGGEWPVDILDVTDEEADKLLMSLDPIAAQAIIDADALARLSADVQSSDEGLRRLWAEMAENAGIVAAEPPNDFAEYDEEIETAYCCPKCGYRWSGKPE